LTIAKRWDRDPDPDRCRDRHLPLTRVLPGDPAVFFARPGRHAATIAESAVARARPAAARPVRPLCQRSRPWQFRQFAVYRPSGRDRISSRLPASAELTLSGLFLAIVIRGAARIGAVKQGSLIDYLCRIVATAGVSCRCFSLPFCGLISYFKLGCRRRRIGRLDAFATSPPNITGLLSDRHPVTGDFRNLPPAFGQLILPASTLAVFSLAPITRMTRASMLAVCRPSSYEPRAPPADGRTVISPMPSATRCCRS